MRAALAPKAPGNGRGAPPVVAVRPAKTQAVAVAEQPAGETAMGVAVDAPIVAPPSSHVPALVLEPPGAEVMPPRDAPPLAGLPYFDDAGHAHGAVQSPVAPPTEEGDGGQLTAITLERIAARIRAGTLVVPASDVSTSEAATLAAVLASMLRQQH